MTPADEPLFREIDAPAGRVDGTVVLLNGGFMTTASWEPLARSLAECCRVVRCDFRGQLRSPGQVREELAGNVGDLVALLDGLDSAIDGGIEPVHLLGTSFGGEIALLLAARHPERVASLVAV
ncbi:MAG: alpha/beta fold hydrolase, partial [Thermoanaerobaculia bacterium]|nr:alpha/beta fold hydrolase [Thermoanaerobaculia bacterium]